MSVIACSCRWKRQVNCRSPRTFLERRSVLLNIWSRRGRLLQHDPPGETPEILICQIDLKTTCVHFFRNFLAVVVELEVSDTGAQTQTADPAFKPLLDLQIFQKLGSRWTHFMNLLYNFCSFVVVVLFLFFPSCLGEKWFILKLQKYFADFKTSPDFPSTSTGWEEFSFVCKLFLYGQILCAYTHNCAHIVWSLV